MGSMKWLSRAPWYPSTCHWVILSVVDMLTALEWEWSKDDEKTENTLEKQTQKINQASTATFKNPVDDGVSVQHLALHWQVQADLVVDLPRRNGRGGSDAWDKTQSRFQKVLINSHATLPRIWISNLTADTNNHQIARGKILYLYR